MMSLAAHNPIFGQTKHPQRLRRSPGGSSAGEGAAIGAGASMLGIGSDIGKCKSLQGCENLLHHTILGFLEWEQYTH